MKSSSSYLLTDYHRAGKIYSVYCKHFVTYNECIFHPKECLNVIIGPNGAGKSTLMSAIILGLGGEPILLSRSTLIADYIKNGEESAIIIVEIFSSDYKLGDIKTVALRRCFDTNGKSEYSIDKHIVTKSKFLQTIANFNIQVSNLCQFLPQDQVQNFAKMSPQEIFQNTMTSICKTEHLKDFKRLKELRKAHLIEKNNRETKTLRLNELKTRLQELQQCMQRFNKRIELEGKLNLFKIKKLWLEVADINQKSKDRSQDLNKTKKLLEDLKHNSTNLLQIRNSVAHDLTTITEILETKKQSFLNLIQNTNQTTKEIERFKTKLAEYKLNYKKTLTDIANRQKYFQNENRILEVFRQDFLIAQSSILPESEKTCQLQEIEDQLQKLKLETLKQIKRRTKLNIQLDENILPQLNMLKKKIGLLENVTEQKLQIIKNSFPDLYAAVEWIQENQHFFAGRVYKAMLLELNVVDSVYAKYFENTIPFRDLLALPCESKSDVSFLIQELCLKQRLSVNIFHVLSVNSTIPKKMQFSNLRKYGFSSYLIDLIEGPPALLNYLCSMYNIHKIPIGTSAITGVIPKDIRLYFGGDQRYLCVTSKYTGQRSFVSSFIKDKGLMICKDNNELNILNTNLSEILKKTDILKNERSLIEANIDKMEMLRTKIISKKRSIDSKLLQLEELNEKVKSQSKKVQNLEDEFNSVPPLVSSYNKKEQEDMNKIIKLQHNKMQYLKSVQRTLLEKQIFQLKSNFLDKKKENLLNEIEAINEKQNESQKLFDIISHGIISLQKKSKLKKEEAIELSGNCKPTDKHFAQKEEYMSAPNDLENILHLINEYTARICCMEDVDEDVNKEYKTTHSNIETLKSMIEDITITEEDLEIKIKSIFVDWYRQVCDIIHSLNEQFGKFMQSMKYIGEVFLCKQSEFDFDTYGLKIMVQYRNSGQLQTLDRYVQSGGERAVAIATFTLSLQHLTDVPFRCVDEINQGMDVINEGKIFKMLVNETTRNAKSQYFFITPKWMSNLAYTDKTTVHIIFNGKLMENRNVFSEDKNS